ncbi:MAG: hypothetical protein ABSC29_01665 [Minisyncoccia bacterium]|jgi:hypothetical protein
MAEDERNIKLGAFTCLCGAEAQKLDGVGLTDRREMYVCWTCPECGNGVSCSVKLSDLWRACPPHGSNEQKLIEPPYTEPKPIHFTRKDAELMRMGHVYIELDEASSSA